MILYGDHDELAASARIHNVIKKKIFTVQYPMYIIYEFSGTNEMCEVARITVGFNYLKWIK